MYNRVFSSLGGQENDDFRKWIKSSDARVIKQFFISIEKSLEEVLYFIYPNDDGKKVVSVKINELLHRACAEIESQLTAIMDLSNIPRDTNKHKIQQGVEYLGVKDIELELKLTGFKIKPFKDFTSSNNVPAWWTGNNKVKHARETDWNKANLEALINAVGALALVLWGQGKTWYFRHDSYFDGNDFGPTVSIFPETIVFSILERQ